MVLGQGVDSSLDFMTVLIKFSGSQITCNSPVTAVQNYG